MKWLNLSEFGLEIGFRHPTNQRGKLAVIKIQDLDKLKKLYSVDQLQEHLESIGFHRVNSESKYPKFVKSDNKIQPSMLKGFLPINNSHVVEVSEQEAISRLYVDQNAWIEHSKNQGGLKEYWSVDVEKYKNLHGIKSVKNMKFQYDSLNELRNQRFIDFSFENPFPLESLTKYGYDSNIFGIITSDKDHLIELGYPENLLVKEDLAFSLPILSLKNNTFLTVSNIRDTPELLEYPVNSWNGVIKAQKASVELDNIIGDFNKLDFSLQTNDLIELNNKIVDFKGEEFKDILSYELTVINENFKPLNSKEILNEVIKNLKELDVDKKIDSSRYVINNYKNIVEFNFDNNENIKQTNTFDHPLESLSNDKDSKELNKNLDRIEDYGEEVFGARKHFFHNSESTIAEIQKDKDNPFEVLVDKYKKANLWNFKKDTSGFLENKSDELFFFSQSLYSMIPNKLSLTDIDKNKPQEFIEKLKDYSLFVNHFKEIIHTALESKEKNSLSEMTNMLINYKNVIERSAKNPKQNYFEELETESSTTKNIREYVHGKNRKSSVLHKTITDLHGVRVNVFKEIINKMIPETNQINKIYFNNFSENGGVISPTNQLSNYELPDFDALQKTFSNCEEAVGSRELFLMLLGQNRGLSENLQKSVGKALEKNLELKSIKDVDADQTISYYLQLYRSQNDSSFKIDNSFFKNETYSHSEVEKIVFEPKQIFDKEIRLLIKNQQPDKLDLRYPKILQNLTHEKSTDLRYGDDITAEKFGSVFGFRAIQFGNWVTQKERQELLNVSFDGLVELKESLGLSFEDIAYNGRLAIAFGARGKAGRGAAAAHYEPFNEIFNLTKERGAGAVTHEWFHGLDNYAAKCMQEEVKKLVYKSGSFNAVEKNYYLSELMADVDYNSSKIVIDNNPVLKSFYELQKKLNGKMESDEIFSKDGIELIKLRSDEMVESLLEKIINNKSILVEALGKTGQLNIAKFVDEKLTNVVDKLKDSKNIDLNKNLNLDLFTNDLSLNRSNVAKIFRDINTNFRSESIPFGRYTITNPLTDENNRLYREQREDSKYGRELLMHLRMHKVIKETESYIHATAFNIIQKQVLPHAINQLIELPLSVHTNMKQRALNTFIDRSQSFYKLGNSKGNESELSLDSLFNKNNFSSNARKLDMKDGAYWSRTCEKFARCGEAYVTDLFKEKGVSIGYMVQCMEDPHTNDRRSGITPSGQDRVEILESYRDVFRELKQHVFISSQEVEKNLDQSVELDQVGGGFEYGN